MAVVLTFLSVRRLHGGDDFGNKQEADGHAALAEALKEMLDIAYGNTIAPFFITDKAQVR